ncbi:pyruvate water dikinase [Brachybacterium phenoliresistens]|uniref:Pyruvate water dikinase n=1 Tax=Brachybacterium phenoliresistens TaxID=396014 RepID=Z9JQ98_9MICO|nr:PEP/pyruvate-binding domain-containing protein [Brachybacterium phenoliresistens]EWS80545.1 pyruvate water dikinase [Brachybacterium phenoliresistens]
MTVLRLSEIDPARIDEVGGKAAGLAALIRAGERVPEGFCLTTAAFDAGTIPRAEVLAAYRELGEDVAVAVRSSATAEDLPWASFAGQQDTLLDVRGEDDLLAAIEACWESLDSERAIAYRRAQGVRASRMAVVVQRMISPAAAGVLFTANPVTGCRTEMVVDAAPGLGTAVVDGAVDTDHYVMPAPGRGAVDPAAGDPAPPRGCLAPGQLELLRAAGERVQDALGSPQDIEFAVDGDGALWLLQSRAITSLFPLPEDPEDLPRVYMEAGHMQGMLRPFTPMGRSAMQRITHQWFEAFGARARAEGPAMVAFIGGRMYLDLTAFVRSARMRRSLPRTLELYGPRVRRGMQQVCEDPRFAPRRGGRLPLATAATVALRMGPPMLRGIAASLRHPDRERERSLALIDVVRTACAPDSAPRTPRERLETAEAVHRAMLAGPMMDSLNPLWTAMMCQQLATALLRGIAEESEVMAVMRGAPHNITTRMDLELWSLADGAREHEELLTTTPTEELVRMHRDGTLPEIGLDAFLDRYGHRAAAEIDIGVPRWEDDPGPIFDAIAGYLQLTDLEQAPDRRFARAAAEAEAQLAQLVERAAARSPLRARAVGFLLRRARMLIGLRELPKFLWLMPLRRMRRELLAIGEELAAGGILETAEDILFLELDEVAAVLGPPPAPAGPAADADPRALVAQRRTAHAREMRRRHVPVLLLSDGTDVEATLPALETPGAITGMSAAPGSATGPARIVTDPAGARIAPGEILVAPTTDPGWTPLFMTAAGLVTETGSPMAHGPTVAREYGIPAVICVPDATVRIRSGQIITVDGAAGTVRIHDEDAETGR